MNEIEIAYRVPGSTRGWVRKTFKTEAQAEAFVARLIVTEVDGYTYEGHWLSSWRRRTSGSTAAGWSRPRRSRRASR